MPTRFTGTGSVYYRYITAKWCSPYTRHKVPVVYIGVPPRLSYIKRKDQIYTTGQGDRTAGVSPGPTFIEGPREFILPSSVASRPPGAVGRSLWSNTYCCLVNTPVLGSTRARYESWE